VFGDCVVGLNYVLDYTALVVRYRTIAMLFRLIRQSRPDKAGLKCPHIHPSTRSIFDFN